MKRTKKKTSAFNLSLDDATKNIVEESLEAQIERIDKDLVILETKKRAILDALSQLRLNVDTEINLYESVYNKDWDWGLKVKYILIETGCLMVVGEIVKKALEYEPERENDDREKTRKLISNAVMNHSKYGKLIKYEVNRKFYYGLPEWFNKNGEPNFGMFNNE